MHTLRPSQPLRQPSRRSVAAVAIFLCAGLFLTACSRFHKEEKNYVYVATRQVYLRDRVAAVSNRVGLVTNGQALEVVERGKRFIKVRTPKGEVGWLEEHSVIDDKLYGQFQDLDKKYAQAPVIATGTLRDDRNLHILPGRNTDHFLLIPGNAKLQLLARGTVAKAAAPGFLPIVPKPSTPKPSDSKTSPGTATSPSSAKPNTPATAPKAVAPPSPAPTPAPSPAPVPMEDWWLVRDASGHTGWLLAGGIDTDVPEEIGGYAEGQRIVGAYAIAKVMDSGVEKKSVKKSATIKSEKATKLAQPEADAQAAATPTEHTEYVTVLTPKGGLPYDFDQLRVFTWSLNHHRYETGYRLRGIQGYLPVKLGQETVNGQTYPTFSFQIASTLTGNPDAPPDVKVDTDTGITRPVSPRTLSFRLEGNLVRRTGVDQNPIGPSHDAKTKAAKSASKPKAATKKKKR